MSPLRDILLIICLARLASSQTVKNCPTSVPRDEYTVVYKDLCFQFVLYRQRDYSDAEKDCESRGGTLALAKTKDVQQFLQTQAQTYGTQDSLWIGLSDQATENTFVWEDKTALDDAQSSWADGEGPRTGLIQHQLEDCVVMDTADGGLWKDYHCENELFGLINYEKYYICSYKLIPL